MAKPIILMETRAKAIEPVPGGMRQKRAAERLGAGVGTVRNRVRAYREGDMAASRPENRDTGQADKLAMRRDRDAGDAETPRRRVEEPELGNAVMREVAEAFASSKGRYGHRRIKAMLRTGVSEKALRRIMAEDGLTAHVPERRGYGSYEGEATPAPGDLADRDFTAEMPNEKWLTDITEIKARDGKVYLSPPIDCYDGKIVAYTAGPDAGLADRMLVKAAETPPEGRIPWCIPTADATAGGPYGWRSWTATAGAVDGRQGPFPGRRRGGVPRAYKDGIRLSRALGGAYPRRGARPDRRLHPLVRPRAHQTAARLDESCTNTVKAREWLRDHLQENVRSPSITKQRMQRRTRLNY